MATQPAIMASASTGDPDNAGDQQLYLAESSMDTNPANEEDQPPKPSPKPSTSTSSTSGSGGPKAYRPLVRSGTEAQSKTRPYKTLAGQPKPHTDHPTVSHWSSVSACQMYTECTKAAESYWWRSGFNRACDTVLGVLSICSCAGSLAAKLLPADTTALAEWKHVLLPLSVVSLTVWYLGDWSTAAKKQLELHNKLRVLARRAKNIETALGNTDGISRDATSCAMSSPLQLTLKVLCMVVVVAPQPRHGKRNGTASCESARTSKEQRQLRHVLGLITRRLPRRTESSRSWSNGLRGSWLESEQWLGT